MFKATTKTQRDGLQAKRLRVLYISQMAEPDKHDLTVYDDLADGRDDIAWFSTRLAELGITELVDLHSVQVCLGEPIPDACQFDAALIGGSYHMVSENRPWHTALFNWLGDAWRHTLPCMGICGGHQLMGAHFGAMVEAVPDEVWCETTAVTWTDLGRAHWLLHGVEPNTPFHFANYEHVATVPPQARALASRETSPAVALDYGNDWVSVQFHPEMSVAAMACSWADSHPERVARYVDSHRAPRLLLNFLVKAGLSATDVIRSSGAT